MGSRYQNISIENRESVRCVKTVIYPEIELSEDDFYVISTDGDRYDKLALQFYNNSDYWWIIAVANMEQMPDSLYITPGTQLRIPASPAIYVNKFEDFNK